MNTPLLETPRLILRKFSAHDLDALLQIYGDEEVNRFLPWFPVQTREEAMAFYQQHFARKYRQETGYHYAICLKERSQPVGYIHVDTDSCYDLGYGLRKEFWHRGIATEAGRAVAAQLKRDGIPYLTATHDVNNPRSGAVMKRLGMEYQYSYEELWMPKNILVVFRLYQLNLDGNSRRVCRKYWDNSAVHFVEPGL